MNNSAPTEDEKFFKTLFGEDELGVVIRAHTYLESRIIQFIEARVDEPQAVPKLRYEQRVKLAQALLLEPTLVPPLIKFGHIRNEFGHKLDMAISDSAVNSIYEACSDEDKARMAVSYSKTFLDLPELSYRPHEALSARERFILLSVYLHASLAGQARLALDLREHLTNRSRPTPSARP